MISVIAWLAAGAGIAAASYATYVAVTWLRYGHAKGADPLLDTFMRDFDVCGRHQIATAAPANVTLAAAKTMKLDSSRIIHAIFRARELILRSKPDASTRSTALLEAMKEIGWGVLADVPDREIVMGAVTKPWEPNPVFRALPPREFAAFADPGYVKIVWTLRADPTARGSLFRTETRAVATDAQARRQFRLYWAFLSPGISLIRASTLSPLKRAAERSWQLEGDDILPDTHSQLTHAISIDAPPSHIWPWLVQMGCQRAGWYSWDVLDNAGVRSAERIIPELQHLAPGDVLPARPTGKEGFEVLRVLPERALVLSSLTPQWKGTWAFVLEPMGANATRLVARYRAAFPPSVRMAVLLPVIRAVHAFMQSKQLRTIKHHAEHNVWQDRPIACATP